MTAKEYLSEVERLDVIIKQHEETLEMLKDQVLSTTTRISSIKVQSTSKTDRIGDIVAKMVDMENMIEEKIAESWDLKCKIIAQIQGLKNPLHSQILFEKYINCKGLQQISNEIGYTYQYVVELHGKALKAFGKQYQELLKEGK
ncbi:DUF1492 domain-containing protein [Gemmiger formicilis]